MAAVEMISVMPKAPLWEKSCSGLARPPSPVLISPGVESLTTSTTASCRSRFPEAMRPKMENPATSIAATEKNML